MNFFMDLFEERIIIVYRCETILPICTNATCSNNGVCYIDASKGTNVLQCICSSGYTGQNCQTLINSLSACASNPCGYNGTCYPTSNSSYYCICPNGAVGSSCSSSKYSFYNIEKNSIDM